MNYPQLFAQEQVAARGMKLTVRDPDGKPVDLAGLPFHIAGATLPPPSMPPRLGEHTDQVLREVLGLDDKRIQELRQKGII
jgi:formyl-CoA transferase